MLRGDLASNPLGQLLADLAVDAASGCIYLGDPAGGETHVYLDSGRLDGVRPAPARDPLGPRLVADGRVRADQLEALGEPSDDRSPSLAERLLEHGLLSRGDVDGLALELALDTLEAACGWTAGAWRFRRRQRAALPLPIPQPVDVHLQELRERSAERTQLAAELGGSGHALAELVPTPHDVVAPDRRATLPEGSRFVAAQVDGTRDIGGIARLSGRSDLAVARLLLELRPAPATDPDPGEAADDSVDRDHEADDLGSDDHEHGPHEHGPHEHGHADDSLSPEHFTATDLGLDAVSAGAWNRVADDQEVSESLAKLSVALNEALGDGQVEEVPDRASQFIRSGDVTGSAAAPSAQPVRPVDPETVARRERLRSAAAAELAAAHAEAEEARRTYESSDRAGVVDLSARREAARALREAQQAGEPPTTPEARAASDALTLLNEDPLGLDPLLTSTSPGEYSEPAAQLVDGTVGHAELIAPALSEPPVVDADSPAAPRPADPMPISRPWQSASADDHHLATALLREMAGESAPSASAEPTLTAPTTPPDPAPAATGPAAGLRRPLGPGGSADTAALLRELSSLGDEPAGHPTSPGPRPGAGRPPVTNAAAGRRRKGIWGRG